MMMIIKLIVIIMIMILLFLLLSIYVLQITDFLMFRFSGVCLAILVFTVDNGILHSCIFVVVLQRQHGLKLYCPPVM